MNAKLDTDEAGYPVHRDNGIKCGNHGRMKVYHLDISTVRFCFDLRRDQEAQQRAEIEAEQAYERHLENRGADEAYAQDQWEARNGVVDFATAFAEARREAEEQPAGCVCHVVRNGRVEPCPVHDPATELRGNDWGKWSPADRERAQAARVRNGFASRSDLRERRPNPSPVKEAGIYRNPRTQEIFKVQVAVHGSGNLYAKRMVALDEPVDMGKRGVKTHEFVYAKGALSTLRADWKLTVEQCQEFGALYGTCVRCGLTLTKESSIERGMGDTCYGKASRNEW